MASTIRNIFHVYGNSMSPIIRHDSRVRIRYTKKFLFGDIVVYKRGKYVMHRIVKFSGDKIITKGDFNPIFDIPLEKSKVIAKIVEADGMRINRFDNRLIALISCTQGYISTVARHKILDRLFRSIIRMSAKPRL